MYYIGMKRKSDGMLFICDNQKGIESFLVAEEQIRDLASRRSEDYEYVILQIKASAFIEKKPVKVKHYTDTVRWGV